MTATAVESVFPPRNRALFDHNLKALHHSQPALASLLHETPVPPQARLAIGRDGAQTIELVGDDGTRTWFGGSSMPTVSAAEMLSNCRADCGNVSLPGILTGAEPLVILEKIPAFRALFVIEWGAANLVLAMHLYDYSAEIARNRLAFILEDDLPARLSEYFESHPGCELPTQMFTVPHRSAAATAELQSRLERAGENVLRWQARTVETLARQLGSRTPSALPVVPRVAVVTVDPSPGAAEQVRRIERACGQLGWPTATCVPDSPDGCHVLARLRTIERHAADWVLMINSTAQPLRAFLPTSMPVTCWFAPDARAPDCAGALESHDFMAFSSRTVCDRLIAAGASPRLVLHVPPAADVRMGAMDVPPTREPEVDAAVLMDVPDDRPEANGVTLPSYVALWKEMRRITAEAVDRLPAGGEARILAEAERSTGVALADPVERERLLSLVATRIIPAVSAATMVQALIAARISFGVWGCNWSGTSQHRGLIPQGEALAGVFHSARFAVLPQVSEGAVQLALDAMAAGSAVMLRTSRESFLHIQPELRDVCEAFGFYATSGELVGAIRGQVRDTREAARTVRERHSFSARLDRLAEVIRGQAAARS